MGFNLKSVCNLSCRFIFSFILANNLYLGLLGILQSSALNYFLNHPTTWVVVRQIASIPGVLTSPILNKLLGYASFKYYWASSGIVYGFNTGVAIVILQNATLKKVYLSGGN